MPSLAVSIGEGGCFGEQQALLCAGPGARALAPGCEPLGASCEPGAQFSGAVLSPAPSICPIYFQIARLEQTWMVLRQRHTEGAILYEKKLKPFLKSLNEGKGNRSSSPFLACLLLPALSRHGLAGRECV